VQEIAALLERGLPDLPRGVEVLGPVPVDAPGGPRSDPESVRLVLRVPRTSGAALSAALRALQAGRSARKEPHLRVEVDPVELG
jgi:primosomal protein N' (replication factor Y)